MELENEIVHRHNLTEDMLNEILPDVLIAAPDHTLVDDQDNRKLVKVSSYEEFAEFCCEKKHDIGNSKLIVYASPYLSLSDATRLGTSFGDLVCEGVAYKIGNPHILDQKIKRNISIVQKTSVASNFLSEVKAKGRPKVGPDIEWFKLNRRYACDRYITSLMRTGTDKEVHDAIKACRNKTHTEVYGGDEGFDEWCRPDVSTAQRIEYTQQRLDNLRNMYMAQYPNASDPVEERRNVLAAQGQLTQKKVENELRGELVSLTHLLEHGLKHAERDLGVLNEARSLAGFKFE